MAIREHIDGDGVHWKIWRVVPTSHFTPAYPHPERRRRSASMPDQERRKGFSLTAGMENGWLCFESAAEKRRLFPIPGDWEDCPEAAIGAYLQRAQPAMRRLVESPAEPVMDSAAAVG